MTTTTKQNELEVANTIAAQIGGRAFFMMGTRYKTGDDKSLMFDIRGSRKANKIKITLDFVTDTYTVEFFKVRGLNVSNVKTVSFVYADSLKTVIESNTGLLLSL